jgi:rhodanese-related sulfurtransferase
MKSLLILLILVVGAHAKSYDKVKITPDISYIYVYHKGKAVKVHRIQDTKHKLTGEYAKQYRPHQYIQPIKMHKDIQTIGEVELLHFMKEKSSNKKGILIDLRSKTAYRDESIPSAVNIPASVKDNKVKLEKILKVLGAKRRADGTLDTKRVMEIAFYCNGLWCDKSSEFIKVFLKLGYPADKILYYRGGFQMWKILGFTTVTNK